MVHLGEETLTPWERRILELLAERPANKRIGTRLDVSPEMVKFHLARIFEKLGARNRTVVTRIATRRSRLRRILSGIAPSDGGGSSPPLEARHLQAG